MCGGALYSALMRMIRLFVVLAMAWGLGTGAASAQAPKDPRAGIFFGGGATYLTVPKGVSRKMGPRPSKGDGTATSRRRRSGSWPVMCPRGRER